MAGFYFLLVLCLSSLSVHFFPLNDDEVMYDFYSRQFSALMRQGVFSGFHPPNNFLKVGALTHLLGGSHYLSLVSFNGFLIFLGCDLYLSTFNWEKYREKILYFGLLFPPILYLLLRPSKEALVTFLICLTYYAWSKKLLLSRIQLLILVGFFYYLFRWQYTIALIAAVFSYLCWRFFFSLSSSKRKFALSFVCGICILLLAVFYESIQSYLNLAFFKSYNVNRYANNPQGALIYKLMLQEEHFNGLNPWNIFIAHVGGFVTPHPLRFLKEYLRDGIWNVNIVEEFLFVSFWFFLMLPVFLIHLKEDVFAKIDQVHNYQVRNHVFQLLFAFMLFSMACFTLLYQTPQLFRYKVPLNVYFSFSVFHYVQVKGRIGMKEKLLEYRKWLYFYAVMLFIYSFVYLYSIKVLKK